MAAMMQWRKIGRVSAYGLAGVLVLVLILFAGTQTGPGRSLLARGLENLLSSTDQRIAITGLEGRVPDRITVGEITVSDADGPWLTARRISLDWRPLQLIAGKLHIAQLHAEELQLARLPASDDAPVENDEVISVPALPVDLRVDRAGVDAIQIGEPVIGQAAAFRLSGSLSAQTAAAIRSTLDIERIDGPRGSLLATSSFDLVDHILEIDARLTDAPDGLIAHLLELDGLPEIDIALAGRGPVDDWRGHFTGGSGANRIEADIAIAAAEDIAFNLDGRAALAELVPPDFQQLTGSAAAFSIDGAWQSAGAIGKIKRAQITGDAGSLALSGELNTATNEVAALVQASLDGGSLDPLTDPVRLGAVALEADVAGTLALPEIRFSVRARDVASAPVSAAAVNIVGEVSLPPDAAAGRSLLDIAATVETEGFALDVAQVNPALGAQPRAFVAGTLDLSDGVFSAQEVRLTGAAFASSMSGTIALDGAAATLAFSASAADLRPLALPVSLNGAAQIVGDAQVRAGQVTATIRGAASKFSSGVDAIDGLLGDRFDLAAQIAGDAENGWRVTNIAVDAVNASLGGDVSVSADTAGVNARYRVRVPDVAPLSAALGAAMAGSVAGAGTVSGRFDDLALSAQLDGVNIVLNELAVSHVSLAVDATDLTGQANGVIALDIDGPLAATAQASFRLLPDTFQITGFEAEGLGLRATGELEIPTEGGAIAGTVRADARDLAPLATAFGQRLSGQASATLEFGEAQSEPNLAVSLEGRNLALDLADQLLRVNTLSAAGQVAYAREQMGLSLSLEAAQMTASQGTLDNTSITLEGTINDIRFSADTRGDIAGETDLSLAGAVKLETDRTVVQLAALSGRMAGRELALRAPAELRVSELGFALDRLQLAIDGGEIDAHGEFSESAVAGGATLNDVPLAAFAVGSTALPLNGVIDGELRLAGTPARPSATLQVAGQGLQLRPIGQGQPISIELSLTASLDNDLLNFEAKGNGGQEFSLAARGQLPVRVSAAPVEFAIDQDRAVDAKVDLVADVAVLEQVAPIDPHRLRGMLRAQAAVAGTIERPVITGEATLNEATYENVEIGTVFDSVTATVALADNRAKIRATAVDSASGQLDLRGEVEVVPPRAVDLSLRMSDVTLVRRDEVTAALSGDLFASGNIDSLLVNGQVETRGVEVRLIDALPPDIVKLEVTEVGQNQVQTARPAAENGEPFGARLEIDVNIPNRLFVRGRGLDSEWQGRLRVFGTTQDAEVTGQISPVRGQYSFAGKTFDLSGGQIKLDERDGELVAVLDVAATFEDDDFVATIKLTGPATQPEIALSSTPELPRDEILSRILFGRGTGQLSPLEALQLAEAAASLSGVGVGSDGVLDKFRTALGVDVLQVSGGEGDTGATVETGKYVAKGVFVGAKQGAGPDTSAATVEIELTPNISVESEVGQTGRSEVGVTWQYNY